MQTRKLRAKIGDAKTGVGSIAFSPDGKSLAAARADNTVKIWDLLSGELIKNLAGHLRPVRSLAISPNGAIIASGGFDSTLRLWDFTTGKNTQTLEIEGYQNVIIAVAFSPDGKLLASASQDLGSKSPTLETALTSVQPPFGGNIKLWEAATGKCIATIQAKSIECIAFSPDGKTLASGSKNKTIQLWDAANAREITAIKGHTGWVTCVAFSPDGKTLASGSHNTDKSIRLWDMQPAKAK
ncbi:MAG TPA: WD40 repeat domain-containing protein [Gemmataceae bacterium]|nr:WD40 repeat domain-containing protein [Gemmataceae bacterium]